jgi:hypothetical protein
MSLTKTQAWVLAELNKGFKSRLDWMDPPEDGQDYIKQACEDDLSLARVWDRLTEDEQDEVICQFHNHHFIDGPYPEDYVYMPWE